MAPEGEGKGKPRPGRRSVPDPTRLKTMQTESEESTEAKDTKEVLSADDSANLVRDHLANERTYLAWTRTGMALLGLGFVSAKLGVDLPASLRKIPYSDLLESAGIALLFALAGLVVVGFGTWRFLDTEQLLRQKHFRPLGYRVLYISGAFIAIGLAVVTYLLRKT